MPGVSDPARLAFPREFQDIQDRITALENRQDGSTRFTTGDLKYTALGIAQTGWLLCDATAITIASGYIALRDALIAAGNPYGVVGADPKVPDSRGRTLIDFGSGPGLTARALGATLGEENHFLTSTESGVNPNGSTAGPSWSTRYSLQVYGSGGGTNFAYISWGGGFIGSDSQKYDDVNHGHFLNGRNADVAHNTMQPSLAACLLIKI